MGPPLGLHCSVWAFLVVTRRGYSLVAVTSHCSDCSCCRAQALAYLGFSSSRNGLSGTGLSCPVACGIFSTWNQTHVPCIGRHIPNQWTTRGVLFFFLIFKKMLAVQGLHCSMQASLVAHRMWDLSSLTKD